MTQTEVFPTIPQVRSCILSMPDRPPFILAVDLAGFYDVQTWSIGQAVKRHPDRFPDDFAFHLSDEQTADLKSQTVISMMANRANPLAFTEAGALALSGVLRSARAAQMSVLIHRAFVVLLGEQRKSEDERSEALEAYEEQARLAASTLLAAQPMWNKIARLQEAGVVRDAIRHHINRSEGATDAILDLMERSGAIDWTAWAGWDAQHRRHVRKSDFYSRAIMRRNVEAGAYSPEVAATIEAALAEPVVAR